MFVVGVIGAGLQGRRRIPAVLKNKDCKLKWVCDLNLSRAQENLSGQAKATVDWQDIAKDSEVNVVMVLTPPDSHFEMTSTLLNAGKHVLCEKPLTRTSGQGRELVQLAKSKQLVLKCGFNHRHHPAVLEAQKRITQGELGKILFSRGKYGIGGRQEIKSEWRSDTKVVSGGQLMEQGIHLIDLIRWLTGEISEVTAMTATNNFPIEPLEDNAFVLMRGKNNVLSSIHSTLCQWINTFELEVYGEKGFLAIEGLGTSYGVEKLKFGIHLPSKPFNYETIEYRGGDVSWDLEWNEFVQAIKTKQEPLGSGYDGMRAIEIVENAYRANTEKKTLSVMAQL